MGARRRARDRGVPRGVLADARVLRGRLGALPRDGRTVPVPRGDVPTESAAALAAGGDVATSSDPEMQKLLLQQQQLTEQIDDLRRRRTMLPADEFDKQLEKLITDLAVVSRKIRTGN